MTSLKVKQTDESLLFIKPEKQTPWAALASFIRTKNQQHAKRTAFKEILELPPHLLKDIGVTYEDVRRAANLPIEADASMELRRAIQCRPMHI